MAAIRILTRGSLLLMDEQIAWLQLKFRQQIAVRGICRAGS